ncbi:unnamed protein product [Cercospora beticola]|nr:unnamed protein product [Cercospora beticola]
MISYGREEAFQILSSNMLIMESEGEAEMTIDEVATWKERGALLLRTLGEVKRIAVGVSLLALVMRNQSLVQQCACFLLPFSCIAIRKSSRVHVVVPQRARCGTVAALLEAKEQGTAVLLGEGAAASRLLCRKAVSSQTVPYDEFLAVAIHKSWRYQAWVFQQNAPCSG